MNTAVLGQELGSRTFSNQQFHDSVAGLSCLHPCQLSWSHLHGHAKPSLPSQAVGTQSVLLESFGSQLQALKCGGEKAAWGNLLPQTPEVQQQPGCSWEPASGRLRCTEETQRAAPAECSAPSVCEIQSGVALSPRVSLLDWFYSPSVSTAKSVWVQNTTSQMVLSLNVQILPGVYPLEYWFCWELRAPRASCARFEEGVLRPRVPQGQGWTKPRPSAQGRCLCR